MYVCMHVFVCVCMQYIKHIKTKYKVQVAGGRGEQERLAILEVSSSFGLLV